MIKTLSIVMLLLLGLVACEDYYKTLGINRDASEQQVKKAFKKMAIKFHPDKNK
jgi:DnaJ-class molecular chaperone